MTTNRKRHLKSEFARFQTSSILFNFIFISQIMLAKFGGGGVESERTVSKFRKRKRKFLCCVHSLHKASAKILAIFMSQSRSDGKENVEKSMMHLQTCCFANIHLFQKRLSERTANGNCRMEIVRPKGSVGFEY